MLKNFSKINTDQMDKVTHLLNPDNFYMFPSSISTCYDLQITEIFSDSSCVIGKLSDPLRTVWSLNTNKKLTSADIEDAFRFISNYDDEFTGIGLVSENCIDIKSLEASTFNIVAEDESNFPYIYDVFRSVNLQGHEYSKLRREINNFLHLYSQDVSIKCSHDIEYINSMKKSYNKLFHGWVEFGTDGSKNIADELFTFNNFLHTDNSKYFSKIFVVELWYRNKLVSFSINDIINNNYAINYFHICNLNLSGISYFLFFALMNQLNMMGVTSLNFQEDCGITGLRTFKQYLRPDRIERTYFIKR